MFSSHRDKFQRFLLNELGSARSKVPKGLGKSFSSTSRPGDNPRDIRRITRTRNWFKIRVTGRGWLQR